MKNPDMLSVEESSTTFLQNSIKNDHCYTNLLPSSDPNGPSFFVTDVRSNASDPGKGKGKVKPIAPGKARKIVKAVSGGSPIKAQVIPHHSKQHDLKESVIEFGKPRIKPLPDNDDPNYEEDVDIEDMDSDGSAGVEEDNLSDEDYNDRTGKRVRKKPGRKPKRMLMKKQTAGRPPGRPPGRPGGRLNKRSRAFEEMRVRNEKLDDEMAKVVQSLDGRSKRDDYSSARGVRKGFKKKFKELGEPRVVIESRVLTGDAAKAQSAKYPKRENRKPPAHLAEAFGPALFSTPDIIRRISTGDELPQTPSEKKNFTVGVQKGPAAADAKVSSKDPGKQIKLKKMEADVNHVKASIKVVGDKTAASLLKTLKGEPGQKAKVTVESIEEKNKIQIPVATERAVIIKKSNSEVQKLVQKHQGSPIRSSVYQEDQDYSDENIDDNYYLDPTQMDQSLLEGFGQQNCKSEDQLLQEAILLQEQLIGTSKGVEIEGKPQQIMSFEETFRDVADDISVGFVPETIDNIQNEIATSLLLESQNKNYLKPVRKAEETAPKRGSIPERRSSRLGESQSEADDSTRGSPQTDGNLVVDESKNEDRRRNSTKRRRSDEVSDLDSDLDDALSEASWNSEDDPDRLWCICRKPHNNRFMICCDVCEEWFHGKCVGITKTIGKQMEQDGLEWSCPNCTKKKKQDENTKEAEKIRQLKEKMAQSIRDQQQKIRESQKVKNPNLAKEKLIKLGKTEQPDLKQTKISDYSQRHSSEDESVGRKCIMCKGPVRENSIYCSDDCIRKHSQHAISQLMSDSSKKSKSESPGASQPDGSRPSQGARREESRIIVMDASSKKVLVGQQAPTAANLATWLKENPSYHVVYKKSDKSGRFIVTSPKVVKLQPKSAVSVEPIPKVIQLSSGQKVSVQQSDLKSTQLKLTVSPNSKQVKILPSTGAPGKKQVYHLVSNPSGGASVKPAAIIVRQKQAEVIDALPLPVKTPQAKPGKARQPEPTPPPKDAAPVKIDKMQKKKKEKLAKPPMISAGAKEVKQSLIKLDDGKDREKRDDQQIRDSVKKTLSETLKARVQECKEMEFTDEHIDGLAVSIEEKLFKHFENKTDAKYKSKYRSLVFNIKDPKNETLFRKILDNSISPKELVKLSPEELASQELARWREKENQHQLEMIKKTELEAMTIGNTYIMKSHKGEQVIASDQSEKVAAVAAEIDPNTPAKELVSALNSVSSTTQDAVQEEKKKLNSETTLMKMKTKEKEHKSRKERERKHTKRDRRRSRSRSRSRSRRHHSKEKKRSRSRDRDRSRHRHKDRKPDKKREKEGSISPDDKPEAKSEITTSEASQEKTEKKPAVDAVDDADHEPSSTVNIRTPDINVEEPEPAYLWKGSIVMADVAKFSGVAVEVSGECTKLALDIGEKVDIVGRIPFDTVWEYIARMKKMATKDILTIKITPGSDEEKPSYTTLYNYLSKRSRIGVIGKTSDAVKDFYLYPLASHAPVPQVLRPLDGLGLEHERENMLLGIVVRSKNKSQKTPSGDGASHATKAASKPPTGEGEQEKVPDKSYTPPLPDDEKTGKKDPRLKRKVRVHVYGRRSVCNEDDDSPYSPGDSDEDLPPLRKMPKPSLSGITASVTKLLSPAAPGQEGLQDPAEIQRKIEEMNRAIEEQTQQIQSLTSTVPKLVGTVPLPSLPLLASSILTTPALTAATTAATHSMSTVSPSTKPSSEGVELPLITAAPDEKSGSPTRSFTPPIKIDESIPFLPEVTSKISLPSNLQEILNSIQKKTEASEAPAPAPAKTVEDIVKSNTPDINAALSVLNQSKNLLSSLSAPPKDGEESTLSRMTDEDIIRKAKEMETEMGKDKMKATVGQEGFACPPPPGVQDIPMVPFSLPLFAPPSDEKLDVDDRKPGKKFKLDPKMVFESEGVPDFMSASTSWEEKKPQKAKNYKIDIKLTMNAIEKSADADQFDAEGREAGPPPQPQPQPPPQKDEAKYDVDERIMPPKMEDKHRSGGQDGRRRRSDDWDGKRDWKYDRRHWDDPRRYRGSDFRRHGGARRYGGPKFRKERFDDTRDRHLEKEWEGSIKNFEERQRRRNQQIRREEIRRLRKRAESTNN